ncbi:hypothetical protein VPNG_07152 [Cytospora leucostoma]|uniref:Telomeric repeat-binding factor 2-interacting protein 1 n=1 Tax=Cytospora leucostoma TaxID=1230097 RepID=A0A423WJW1_9PEZI|nr:hypothetical protein VPNG_07152 [Cytospora leucostoma]
MPVVYDGVKGSGEGDLFKGLKLWISHRVPQRSRWIDLVKGNGGEVVPLEKQADMLIADNIKRGGAAPPPGSYTWQWIDYSVKNGFLQQREDYLITAASEPRAVGSSAPAKKTRTPFTNHDDLILTKFVVAQERAGNSTKGTEIFKELERKQPRHTWQSWRERWVKNLAYRTKPDLSHSGSDPDTEVRGSPEPPVLAARLPDSDGSAERGRPARSAQEPMSTPKAKQAQPPTAEAEAEAPAPARRPKGRGRNFFTKEEDALLLQYIREAQEYNRTAYGYKVRSLSGNKIYQEFAYEHPNHTWHAWRDRWLRHLSRVDDDEVNDAIVPEQEGEAAVRVDGEQRPQPQPQVNGHTAEPASLAAARKTNTPGVHTEATGARRAALPNPESPSTMKRPQAMTDDERLERREQAKRKVRAANVSVERRDVARFETLVVPLQSLVRGYLVRKREAEALLRTSDERDQLIQAGADGEGEDHYEDAEEELESHDLGPEGSETRIRSARDQFYDDLKLYIHSGAEVDLEPVVEGRKIDLWDLFEAATRQDCSPGQRNWKEVAEDLGFDWVKSARCLPRLWECYLQNLTEFEEAIKSYDDSEGEGEDGDEDGNKDEVGQEEQEHRISAAREEEESLPEISDATIAPKKSLAAPSSHIYQSSPPIAGIKRSFRHADGLSSELSYPSENPRKRRRTDQSEEIPPTPEDKLGLTTDLAAGHNTALVDLSPAKHRGGFTAELLGEEVDELPEHPPAPKERLVAQGRRNSGFVIGGDADVRKAVERGDYVYVSDEDEDEDEDDISPSQQLHNESDAIDNPVPPSSSRHNAVSSTNRRLFAASTSRLAANTVSSPAFNAVKAKAAAAGPNGLVNGKTTRRSLPPTNQQPSASAPPVRASGVPPARAVQPATSRGKYATPSTPTPARPSSSTIRLPSSSRRLPPTSTAAPPPPPPPLPTSSTQSPKFDNDPAIIDAQFAHFQALGYEKAHIGRAMETATFQRGPMTVALQSLHEGRGLPAREAGVWTDSDDERLKAVRDYDRRVRKGKFTAEEEEDEKRLGVRNERFRAKLMAKHGRWVEPRLQFTDMMDQGA